MLRSPDGSMKIEVQWEPNHRPPTWPSQSGEQTMMMTPYVQHDWSIKEREYLRQEERRGRRHDFESVDPVRTALVVDDLVAFFVDENDYARGIVPNVNELAAALRRAGGTVA